MRQPLLRPVEDRGALEAEHADERVEEDRGRGRSRERASASASVHARWPSTALRAASETKPLVAAATVRKTASARRCSLEPIVSVWSGGTKTS